MLRPSTAPRWKRQTSVRPCAGAAVRRGKREAARSRERRSRPETTTVHQVFLLLSVAVGSDVLVEGLTQSTDRHCETRRGVGHTAYSAHGGGHELERRLDLVASVGRRPEIRRVKDGAEHVGDVAV